MKYLLLAVLVLFCIFFGIAVRWASSPDSADEDRDRFGTEE